MEKVLVKYKKIKNMYKYKDPDKLNLKYLK